MSPVKTRLALLLVAALAAAACGSSNNTPTTPTTPAQSIVETFTGTLNPSSGMTHQFSTNNAGDVLVQVTSLDPSDSTVGLSLGTSNTFACASGVSTDAAHMNDSVSGTARASGTLCVHIYDPFTGGIPLAGAVNYSLQVTHF